MAKKADSYNALLEIFREIHTYTSISHLLYWDRETCMPQGSSLPRSMQIAQISSLIHELKTSNKVKNHLKNLANISTGRVFGDPPRSQRIIIESWVDDYERMTKLPLAFVKKFSQITSEASQIWSQAKHTNNFSLFAPHLEKIVEMNREKASIFGFEDHPYDALLEGYEPCMTTKKVRVIFDRLKKEIVSLLGAISQAPVIDNRFLKGKFPAEKQMRLGQTLMAALPMEKQFTRLDISEHPFSIALHPYDSRITTRIMDCCFLSNLFSVLHESGHSMYEMGLPVEHWGTPLAEPVSLSIHESQSRWWETFIGRSQGFWNFFYPHVQKTFGLKSPLSRFYRGIHKITPSFIRVEADEVTYCLHVILRFELEQALISGDLTVADLPTAWRDKMKELLGIVPPTDREGCLQDIHWSLGELGYFPTYALGNLFAAQFFTAFTKEHRNWEERIAQGDFAFIRAWLKTNIHSYGKQYFADQLVKKVTGKPFSEAAYCRYLKKKYSEIYRF